MNLPSFYSFFFPNTVLINHMIKNTHTIKSPNTNINDAPAADNTRIEITAIAMAIKHNVINNIIMLPPLSISHNMHCFYREKKRDSA